MSHIHYAYQKIVNFRNVRDYAEHFDTVIRSVFTTSQSAEVATRESTKSSHMFANGPDMKCTSKFAGSFR